MSIFERTELLLGKEKLNKLLNANVAIFGIGGVGGHTVEALIRAGVQNVSIIDNDVVSESNINRQIIALNSTIGKLKVDVMKDRILDINPNAKVKTFNTFYLPENSDFIDLSKYDYIVDAIDTVTAKLDLIEKAKKFGVNIISCMGTGNKLNPQDLKITDISKTSICPLARVMRRELKKRGIENLKVLYSTEETLVRHQTPSSVSFVPSVAGLIIASEVVKDIINGD